MARWREHPRLAGAGFAGLLVGTGAGDRERHHRLAANQSALLFIAAGGISLVYDLMPNTLNEHRLRAVVLDSITMIVGVIIGLLPWWRWHVRWLAALPVAALLRLSADRSFGVIPNETYGIWIVVVYVWIGIWLPPRASFWMVPVAIVTYLVPFAFLGAADGGTVTAMVISIPVAVVVGETLSRRNAAVARASAERQMALDALAKANVTDDLTGLGNRRQANLLLDRLRPGDALAILDLDHFKRVNDTYGHQRGDHVLSELGEFLERHLRPGDAVARYGGEEFLMVLRQAGGNGREIMERLLDEWRATSPVTTLSAGVANHEESSWSDTFAAADAALYIAKQSGRDRVALATGAVCQLEDRFTTPSASGG